MYALTLFVVALFFSFFVCAVLVCLAYALRRRRRQNRHFIGCDRVLSLIYTQILFVCLAFERELHCELPKKKQRQRERERENERFS